MELFGLGVGADVDTGRVGVFDDVVQCLFEEQHELPLLCWGERVELFRCAEVRAGPHARQHLALHAAELTDQVTFDALLFEEAGEQPDFGRGFLGDAGDVVIELARLRRAELVGVCQHFRGERNA